MSEPRTLEEIRRLGEADPGPTAAEGPAAPMERDHVFVLRVRTFDGQQLEGTCTSRILGTEDRLRLGRARARLAGGLPWESLNPETRVLIDAQVAVAFGLVDRPDWLPRVLEERTDVLLEVYGEVARHEAEFFRRHLSPGAGPAQPPLVQVVPVPGAAQPPDGQRWELRLPVRPGSAALGADRGGAARPPR